MHSTRKWLLFAAPALIAAPFALLGACGSGSQSSGSGGAGGSEQSTTAGVTTGGTMSTGSGPGGPSVAFAINQLYLGDTNLDGSPNKVNGWKQFGFDLDGKVSTATSTDLCQPRSGATANEIYPDGNDGIDNSFGKNALPFLLMFDPSLTPDESAGLAAGGATAILALTGLGSGAAGSLSGQLLGGVALGKAPAFDGTQVWPIAPESLTNPADPSSAKVTFGAAPLTSNTWLGHATGDIVITFDIPKVPFQLTITHAVVAVQLDPTHTMATGTIAGVLDPDLYAANFKKVAGNFDKSLCSGPTITSILAQITSVCDVLANGLQDPGQECAGISIGLGFRAGLVKLGGVGAAAQPPPDPCAP
jgi:hypothetical protein